MLDLKNTCIAFGISLQSCLQAEIYVIPYPPHHQWTSPGLTRPHRTTPNLYLTGRHRISTDLKGPIPHRIQWSVGPCSEVRWGGYGITYISACKQDCNEIPKAIPMFMRSSNTPGLVRILSYVRENGIPKMAVCNRKWIWNNVCISLYTWLQCAWASLPIGENLIKNSNPSLRYRWLPLVQHRAVCVIIIGPLWSESKISNNRQSYS